MRNPVRSETDAFYVAYGVAALIAASLAAGALIDPLVGVALFAGGLFGAAVWELSTRDPDRRLPLREAALEGRRRAEPSSRPSVLVVANRTLDCDELRAEVRRRAAAGAEFHIVVPIHCSRAHYIASDVDKELVDARERLARALVWAREEGISAVGKVGDPNAALGAIEDELRSFGADEVIIATWPPGRSNWLETGIVARLRSELDVPVMHVIAEPDRAELAAGR